MTDQSPNAFLAAIHALQADVERLHLEVRELRLRLVRPSDQRARQAISDKRATAKLDELCGIAEAVFNMPREAFTARLRTQQVVEVRDWIWFEAHKSGLTLTSIGKFFGMDHTTIGAGIKRETARRDGETA